MYLNSETEPQSKLHAPGLKRRSVLTKGWIYLLTCGWVESRNGVKR